MTAAADIMSSTALLSLTNPIIGLGEGVLLYEPSPRSFHRSYDQRSVSAGHCSPEWYICCLAQQPHSRGSVHADRERGCLRCMSRRPRRRSSCTSKPSASWRSGDRRCDRRSAHWCLHPATLAATKHAPAGSADRMLTTRWRRAQEAKAAAPRGVVTSGQDGAVAIQRTGGWASAPPKALTRASRPKAESDATVPHLEKMVPSPANRPLVPVHVSTRPTSLALL
jgi:hypothetical protein